MYKATKKYQSAEYKLRHLSLRLESCYDLAKILALRLRKQRKSSR